CAPLIVIFAAMTSLTHTMASIMLLCFHLQLRKPRVENMLRDCFLKQQPDTKLEKADILEMTLNFLQHHNCSSHAVSQGFSRCVMKTESQRRLLKHFQKLQTSCEQNRRESVLPDQNTFSKEMNVNKSSIWGPW
uniref:BHLH domain-containing protein n=1 Tax=Sinocyclocheilus rhinocerous TaxID=307959 RepID=A0A673LC29_9TELE